MCRRYLETFKFCDKGSSRFVREIKMLCLNFKVVRKARSPDFCFPVQAVPLVPEGEQELSRLENFEWELYQDICIL